MTIVQTAATWRERGEAVLRAPVALHAFVLACAAFLAVGLARLDSPATRATGAAALVLAFSAQVLVSASLRLRPDARALRLIVVVALAARLAGLVLRTPPAPDPTGFLALAIERAAAAAAIPALTLYVLASLASDLALAVLVHRELRRRACSPAVVVLYLLSPLAIVAGTGGRPEVGAALLVVLALAALRENRRLRAWTLGALAGLWHPLGWAVVLVIAKRRREWGPLAAAAIAGASALAVHSAPSSAEPSRPGTWIGAYHDGAGTGPARIAWDGRTLLVRFKDRETAGGWHARSADTFELVPPRASWWQAPLAGAARGDVIALWSVAANVTIVAARDGGAQRGGARAIRRGSEYLALSWPPSAHPPWHARRFTLDERGELTTESQARGRAVDHGDGRLTLELAGETLNGRVLDASALGADTAVARPDTLLLLPLPREPLATLGFALAARGNAPAHRLVFGDGPRDGAFARLVEIALRAAAVIGVAIVWRRRRDALSAASAVLLTAILFGPAIEPRHLVLVLPLAILARNVALLAWSGTILAVYGVERADLVPGAVEAFEYGLPAACVMFAALRKVDLAALRRWADPPPTD
jgi:hypothetical protein